MTDAESRKYAQPGGARGVIELGDASNPHADRPRPRGDARDAFVVSAVAASAQITLLAPRDADWVASEANAAKVISSLHHGEKRLVFADSR